MVNVDVGLLKSIDSLTLSDWQAKLREDFFSSEPGVAGERTRLTIESWKETEGHPLAYRRAKLLEKVLEGVPVPIFRGQRIVGSTTKYFRGAYPHPEVDGQYLTALLAEVENGTMPLGGSVERGTATENDLAALVEGARYWKGKTFVDRAKEVASQIMGSWYEDLVDSGGGPEYDRNAQIPPTSFFGEVVRRGLRSYVREAEAHIQRWKEDAYGDLNKFHFWQASIIALQAAIIFSKRYAQKAREAASDEQDPVWRDELKRIAETCEWVPENPPRTFREALQSLVLIHLAMGLETISLIVPGYDLMDQYLYPYFRRDLEDGKITLQDAGDFIADFLRYAASLEFVRDPVTREYNQKGQPSNLGLGGTGRNGTDMTNELSYLFLHIMGLVRYAEPHLAVRWHEGMPVWFMRKALRCNTLVGGGVPQFQNSDHIVDLATKQGIPVEDALSWAGSGCSQADPGGGCGSLRPSYFNIPLCLDLALHDGIASKTTKKIGVETGDPRSFNTFDELYDAFKEQVEHVVRKHLWHDRIIDQVRPTCHLRVLVSAVLPGCMEKGLDYDMGGLRHYRTWIKKDRGLIPAADSLTAIKKLVYDDHKLTMGQLVDALDQNFEGEMGEEIRQMCLAAPKYGNDDDEPDGMVRQVAKFTAGIITSEKNIFGSPYAINRNGQGWHYMAGKRLAALPCGRKAGEPLADGSLSAIQGMDRKGPTALLNSAIKADFTESQGGILTIKFPPSLLSSEEVQDKVIALTESFFRNGGTYCQYNILDAGVLREAQRNPEKFRDLVVRVGGFSAYFIHLSPEIQDEIIRRTEHSL